MKRTICKFSFIVVIVLMLMAITQPVYAAITTTGDVDPADPATWNPGTEGYIGNTSDGTMDITAGSNVQAAYGYIGYDSGVTGAVTVDGSGSTWTSDYGLSVGIYGNGTLNITNGGLVSVAGALTIDDNGDDDSFINMATGGMLALFGDADDSLIDFLGLIDGSDAINYWDASAMDWADITGATMGVDYTLDYLTEGDLAGYTVLTVPEPATLILLGLGGLALRKRKQ